MKNLKISTQLVDGSFLPFEFKNGKELIKNLISDDWGAPPKSMIIEAISDDGKKVIINVPYNKSNEVNIRIDET